MARTGGEGELPSVAELVDLSQTRPLVIRGELDAKLAEVKAAGSDCGEDRLLYPALVLQPDLRRRVPEPFRVLLGDDRGQREQARALHELGARLGDAGERVIGPEAILHVDHDQRRALALEQAHAAATTEKARSR